MNITWDNGVHEGPLHWPTGVWRRIAPSDGLSQKAAVKVLKSRIPAAFRAYIALDVLLESHWVSGISDRALADEPDSLILSFTLWPKQMVLIIRHEERQGMAGKDMMRRYRHYHVKIGGSTPDPQVSLQPPVYSFDPSSAVTSQEPDITPYGSMETEIKNGLTPKSLIEYSVESIKIHKGASEPRKDEKSVATESSVVLDSLIPSPSNTQDGGEDAHTAATINEGDEESAAEALTAAEHPPAAAKGEGKATKEADVVSKVNDEVANDDYKTEIVTQDSTSRKATGRALTKPTRSWPACLRKPTIEHHNETKRISVLRSDFRECDGNGKRRT